MRQDDFEDLDDEREDPETLRRYKAEFTELVREECERIRQERTRTLWGRITWWFDGQCIAVLPVTRWQAALALVVVGLGVTAVATWPERAHIDLVHPANAAATAQESEWSQVPFGSPLHQELEMLRALLPDRGEEATPEQSARIRAQLAEWPLDEIAATRTADSPLCWTLVDAVVASGLDPRPFLEGLADHHEDGRVVRYATAKLALVPSGAAPHENP